MDHQDWEPVILRKNTERKSFHHHSAGYKTFKKIDSEDAEAPKSLGLSAGKQIQQARVAKKMSQKQLAQKINVKVQVVTDYETGKAIPDRGVLNKLNRVLNIVIK